MHCGIGLTITAGAAPRARRTSQTGCSQPRPVPSRGTRPAGAAHCTGARALAVAAPQVHPGQTCCRRATVGGADWTILLDDGRRDGAPVPLSMEALATQLPVREPVVPSKTWRPAAALTSN